LRVGFQCQQVAQRAERGLKVVVVTLHADANVLRDLGPFPPLEEGFVDDLPLNRRQIRDTPVSEIARAPRLLRRGEDPIGYPPCSSAP
jgi:hypothetical protein